MQFYRRWYQFYEDAAWWRENNTFLKTLSSNGFTQLDGSAIPGDTTTGPISSPSTTNDFYFRWGYDKALLHNNGSSYRLRCEVPNFVWISIQRSKQYSSYNDLYRINYYYMSSSYLGYYFIPLKNRGFVFGITRYDTNSGYYFNPSQPLPIFPYMLSYYNSIQGEYSAGSFGFYNNITNKFNYYSQDWYANSNILDGNDGSFIGNAMVDSNGTSYTDVKNNICTLIKYPYQDGFLNNLFIISTAPERTRWDVWKNTQGLTGKFFSFGGRNFFCPVYNLAVELPAN